MVSEGKRGVRQDVEKQSIPTVTVSVTVTVAAEAASARCKAEKVGREASVRRSRRKEGRKTDW